MTIPNEADALLKAAERVLGVPMAFSTPTNVERLPIGTRIEIVENANEHVTPKYSLHGKQGVIAEYAPDDDGAPAYWVDFDGGLPRVFRRRPIIFSYMVRPL